MEFDSRPDEPRNAGAREAWVLHLERCPECRSQWLVHRMLEDGLAALPVPSLGRDLATDFSLQARSYEPVRFMQGPSRLLMAAYWLGVLALFLYLAYSFGWPRSVLSLPIRVLVLVLAPLSFAVTLWPGAFAHLARRWFADPGSRCR